MADFIVKSCDDFSLRLLTGEPGELFKSLQLAFFKLCDLGCRFFVFLDLGRKSFFLDFKAFELAFKSFFSLCNTRFLLGKLASALLDFAFGFVLLL